MHSKRRTLFGWSMAVMMIILLLSVSVHVWAQIDSETATKGKRSFYLVGMGPGDPDLATVRAMKIVEEADLIICHKSLNENFFRVLKKKKAMYIPVDGWIWFGYGKKAADFQGKQLEKFQSSEKMRGQVITKIREAIRKGKRVAVLASGDPLIYGPWSWTLEEFQDLDPVVVPGISCFNAAHAALKKDVTWSDTVKSTILTADDWPGTKDTIGNLASHQVTMVVFTMGLELKDLIEKLSTNYPPHTPIAIICHAGYKEKEHVIKGTIGTILDKTQNQKLPFEHLVYVGENLNFKWKK
ncbi:MAG: hypothetical protein BA867_04485 [Desulfobacterales bacterium S5133MH16]|nr:MAG: hypothetical protein BA867_04485 [Desulfobacterales bacterium S5133MH16]